MERYVDALQEIGNIGIGNAATALADILRTKINVTVPRATFVPIEEVFTVVRKVEDLVVAVVLRVEGGIYGTILFVFPEASALELVVQLLGTTYDTIQEIDEMGQSVLMEVGNVLAGSFLNAISAMTQLTFIPAVPMLAFDMLGSVISGALSGSGMVEDQVLLIETVLFEEGYTVAGDFFLFFDPGSLAALLRALGLDGQTV
ncbi:MAG: chemotaxis protein CheC [Bacillota bacterium]